MSKHVLPLFLAALSLTATAQVSLVNPVPHDVSGGRVVMEKPAKFKISSRLQKGKKDAALVPQKAEGYYLKVTEKGAQVIGYDAAGVRYGLETLRQLTSKGQIETCEIRDYPDVPFRGVVEGFYGTPWSHQARLRQLKFYGENKLNVYIYGPKDDPYHSTPLWRQPYPAKEAAQLKELVDTAKAYGVNFYWAAHPGQDIRWNAADRDSLLQKFEAMYQLGIRSYAIFFDDIWGEGTKAEKQAELLNFLDDEFINKKPDVAPLIVCPTEYNRAWVNEKKGYLRTMGAKVNKDIAIMWTGNTVVHCIDRESMEWVNERLQRQAYIWWNFPVTDYCRDHLMMGPVYGNGKDIAPLMSGFVSNPMEHAEASKIALYGIADYTWNMEAYDSERDWEKAITDLLPSDPDALKTFASFNEDGGANGHNFRREESKDWASGYKDIAAGGTLTARANYLSNTGRELGHAADLLLKNRQNPGLINELRPWLIMSQHVATYAEEVTTLAAGVETPQQTTDFETLYNAARAEQKAMYELENSGIRHPLQPGIKVGSRWLMPALNQLFADAVNKYNKEKGTSFEPSAEFSPYTLTATVPQLAQLPVTVQGNNIGVRPALEVILWAADGSMTITADRTITLAGLDFDFGQPDMAKNFRLEVKHDGTWHNVSLLHYKDGETTVHTGNELGGMKCDALRLTNISGKELTVKMNRFNFVKQ